MREIKFRGKRIDNDEWVYGYLIGNDVIVGKIVEWDSEFFCTEFLYKVDPETVGQYIGLRDSKRTKEYPNGQEIYEGDVTRRGETTYQIVWMENRAKFGAKVIRSECVLVRNLTFPLDHYVDEHDSLLEVIGNIYEYPELLAGRA